MIGPVRDVDLMQVNGGGDGERQPISDATALLASSGGELKSPAMTVVGIRPHQGHGMNGRTPWRALLDRIPANDNSTEDTDRPTLQATAA